MSRKSPLLSARIAAPKHLPALAGLLILAMPAVAAAEVQVKTQTYGSDAAGFAEFNTELMSRDDANLLKFPGAELLATEGIRADHTSMIADGTAGVWVGNGRIHMADGRPSRVVYYLGRPRLIREIRVLTSNSDSRTNQDYEIRLARSSANATKVPEFSGPATFTSGDKVIGPNQGPCISSVADSEGGNLADERYDLIEFRIYPTYKANAGSPARTDLGGRGWTTLVELQVLPDPDDPELFESPAERAAWMAEIERKRKLAKLAGLSRLAADAVKNLEPLQRAINDLAATYPQQFPGEQYQARWQEFVDRFGEIQAAELDDAEQLARLTALTEQFEAFRRDVLLANPLLDFDKLLMLKRGAKSPKLGLPRNWQSNSCLSKTGYDDTICTLSIDDLGAELVPVFHGEGGRFVGDVDLDFDAQRMLFSMPGENGRWQIFEIKADGSGLRQLTGEQPDVDSYDACYLPDGRIMFTSTACFIGVPCVYGSSHVTNMYVMNPDGTNIRQLTFDQEHNWCPTVMNNGRVLYLRWEYADTPHSNTRLLFHMNPDGTEQFEYYGSNSYWPNSTFYARPVPGHPTKVVGVIGGHHDHPRMGELIVFDPREGRRETAGAVQRIPGWGKKVDTVIADGLTRGSWPKFLHPWPLSEKYFLTAMKPEGSSLWGIYLVDVFDNMLLLKELPDFALLEPIPLKPRARPPVIPGKVDLAQQEAEVYIPDIYAGDGLAGVPRGKVKEIRLVTYHYSYQGMGGLLGIIGMDGPWDIKRVVGTVPVYEDGSAKFRIPANMPIALQPLDEEGKALQLMRSWMTAMPGETVQCAGCHEPQNSTPPAANTLALGRRPSKIEPWYGPLRGFSYPREVQPVIDRHCVSCHNPEGAKQFSGQNVPDLRGDVKINDWAITCPGNGGGRGGKFSVGYAELHRYVRRPGIESDYHMLTPLEYHADTTQLVQMLNKGHHGVELDDEAWDRLVTWIDLNCPYHGTWGEELKDPGNQRQRRRELLKLYANLEDDPEEPLGPGPESKYAGPVEPLQRANPQAAGVAKPQAVECPGWPFDAAEALRRQAAAGEVVRRTVELTPDVNFELVLVPAGEFVMGDQTGGLAVSPDERPAARVKIDRPFWMATCEITNGQFALFDSGHDSRVESKNAYQFGIHGFPVNRPEQPVVRVSWREAMAFCRWLSAKTGERFTLPTEAQWEWACRAGTAGPTWYGDLDTDFAPFAHLSDATMIRFASNPYTVDQPLPKPAKYDDWIPKESRFNDGSLLSVAPGKYQPNPWGLFDMHGNVAEWTRTAYRPYPYDPGDGREVTGSPPPDAEMVARGGSWRDRPRRCTASFRVSYPAWQKVYNVGFRVVCEDNGPSSE